MNWWRGVRRLVEGGRRLEYRSLGKTGVMVSELCLGCMMFGGHADEPASFAVLDAVMAIAREKTCTPGQLAWCKDRTGVTSPIIGPRIVEQLEDNLGAIEVSLEREDHERLDAAAPPGRATVPYYEADFGPHGFRR